MQKILVSLLITFVTFPLFSQTLPKKLNQANWQQKVDYKIDLSLNDQNHSISAFEKMVYYNQSPNSLTQIYIHLWPNAYQNRNTNYAKQELLNGNTKFHFAEPNQRGWIDSLNFKVNGKEVKWQLTDKIDIAILTLNETLLPGNSIEITTPFHVQIPSVFSRMGQEDGIYCITQWYPKPAVYDANGWNPMPYLNQGEFYSEFGSFDVSITLPKNYLLAATGEVQDLQEKEWWLARSKNLNAIHPSNGELKTLRFLQDSVHDFAWFCSKDFMSDKSEVILSNGQKVETWIFAKTTGDTIKPKGIEFVNEGIKFYSDKVGNYPYSIAQVVITPLKAGAGMEYPTITNCDGVDKTTIVHEIGHNWFYGILGSNEREFPWMDESINTYYEERNGKIGEPELEPGEKIVGINIGNLMDQTTMLFKYASRKNIDQAGNLPSEAYTDNNYGAIIYAKNPLAFAYLQYYLGTEKFDAMMQAYYQKWKFKHPLPNDFRNHAESFTNQNLDWFFDGALGSTKKLDYKLVGVKNGLVTIKNQGDLIAPISISKLENDSLVGTFWTDGFEGEKTFNISEFNFPNSKPESKSLYRLDANKKTLDLYRQNNTYVISQGSNKYKPIVLQPIGNLENDNSKQVFWSPVYAFNMYNKSMLGIAFYNNLFPEKKNEFLFMPVYSFGSNDLNGYLDYSHNWYKPGKVRAIQLGFKSSRFATNGIYFQTTPGSDIPTSVYDGISYEKFAPFVQLKLQPKHRNSLIEQAIQLRYVMVNEQKNSSGIFYQFGSDHFGIAELAYTYQNPNVLYPSRAKAFLQSGIQNTTFNKLGFEFNQGFKYKKGKRKAAEIRVFLGGFAFEKTAVSGSKDEYFSSKAFLQGGAKSGAFDYLYDETLIGRAESLGNIANTLNAPNSGSQKIYGRQIIYTEAGFRNYANVGSTNTFLSALNFTVPFPIPIPIGVYGDMSYWQSPSGYVIVNGVAGVTTSYYPSKMNFTYNGGVYFTVAKDVFTIYVPLMASSDVKGYWETNGYESIFSRVSFVLNLNKINPIQFIRDIKL
ncbi:MAG: M1 family metallopeptidase [Bacteroidia bacterium]|nr:M1 family metallopeptidase [Bacteroidia bacterium]MCF8425638.1 M1 family metallopeptidase [Bacteroidia bacterium]MCF8446538.1 M1 family metallopeptidase [Bacteroidia bacterium]